jgi:hypothetical protein
VVLKGDSQIVINRLPGKKVSKGLCRHACLEAQKLFKELLENGFVIDLQWIPRDENEEADGLTEAAADYVDEIESGQPDGLVAHEAHLAAIST